MAPRLLFRYIMRKHTLGAALALLLIAAAPVAAQRDLGEGQERDDRAHTLVLAAMQRPIDYLVLMLDRVPDEVVPVVDDAIGELEVTRDDALAEVDEPDQASLTVTGGTQRAEDILQAEMNKQTPEMRATLHKAQLKIQGARAQALTALRQR
jgi:hypothetical protein